MECILRVVKMRNPWLCSKDASGLIHWDLQGGWYNHTLSLGIERKYLPVKRGFSACSTL